MNFWPSTGMISVHTCSSFRFIPEYVLQLLSVLHITLKCGHPAALVFSKLAPVIWHFTPHTISDAPLFCACLVQRNSSQLVFFIPSAPSCTILIGSPVKGDRGHQAVHWLWSDQGGTSTPTVFGRWRVMGHFPALLPSCIQGSRASHKGGGEECLLLGLKLPWTMILTQAAQRESEEHKEKGGCLLQSHAAS